MEQEKTNPNLSSRPANLAGGNEAKVSAQLVEKARAEIDTVPKELESRLDGLSPGGSLISFEKVRS